MAKGIKVVPIVLTIILTVALATGCYFIFFYEGKSAAPAVVVGSKGILKSESKKKDSKIIDPAPKLTKEEQEVVDLVKSKAILTEENIKAIRKLVEEKKLEEEVLKLAQEVLLEEKKIKELIGDACGILTADKNRSAEENELFNLCEKKIALTKEEMEKLNNFILKQKSLIEAVRITKLYLEEENKKAEEENKKVKDLMEKMVIIANLTEADIEFIKKCEEAKLNDGLVKKFNELYPTSKDEIKDLNLNVTPEKKEKSNYLKNSLIGGAVVVVAGAIIYGISFL